MVQQYGENESFWDILKRTFGQHQSGLAGGGGGQAGVSVVNAANTPSRDTRDSSSRSTIPSRATARVKPGSSNNWARKSQAPVGASIGANARAGYEQMQQRNMPDYSYDAPEWQGGDMTSFLTRAQELIGDGGMAEALSVIENREADAQKRAAQADSRLAAMYDQLRNSILGDSEKIDASYGDAKESIKAAGDTQQEAIKSAYQTTQNTTADVLNRLGIGDAAGIMVDEGNTAARYMEGAANTAATRTAANQDFASSVEQSAKDFNTQNAAAAGLEGTSRRADIQTQLGTLLAQLADEQAATRNEYTQRNQQAALELANQLYSQNYGQYQDKYGRWMDKQNLIRQDDQTGWDRGFSLNQLAADQQSAALEAMGDSEIPWAQLSKPQQFNTQVERQYGPASVDIMSALSQATNPQSGRFTNPGRLVQQLMEAYGLTQAEAQALISGYSGAYGVS